MKMEEGKDEVRRKWRKVYWMIIVTMIWEIVSGEGWTGDVFPIAHGGYIGNFIFKLH